MHIIITVNYKIYGSIDQCDIVNNGLKSFCSVSAKKSAKLTFKFEILMIK